jgi:glycosyltransferase involved in cell wall biosynthesis
MILICELSFLGRAHVPFNAGLLATIHGALPKERITFYGSSTHIHELKRELTQSLAVSIAWTEISPPTSGTAYFRRFICELRILRRLVQLLGRGSNSRLVLTSAYPSTVLAVKIARCFRSRLVPVQIVLHGMSGVVGKRFRRPIRRFQDMKTALTLLGNTGIQYIVLEQSIRDTIISNCALLSGKMYALEHPISPRQAELPAINLDEPIRFGFLGLADEAKGFPVFVETANHITAKYGSRVEFHAIGHIPANSMTTNGIDALTTKPQSTQMSRAAFLRGVTPLHFIVLPHEAASYNLTASGVLIDAIACGKPLISRKIALFESVFKKYGDIGYLFTDNEELKDVIERILQESDKAHYQRQIYHLQNARKARHPEALAEVYNAISANLANSF